MEGVMSSRRPGQEHPGRQGRSHREYERMYSKGNHSVGEKGEDWHHYETRKKMITDTEESSHSKGAVTRQSRMAKSSRHNRWRSPDDSLHSCHRENRRPEGKVRGRLSPAQERREDKPDSTRAGHQARPGFARPPLQLNGRRTSRRSSAKTTGPRCCEDSPACGPASPKRGRQRLSPEAPEPPEVLMSRLFNQVGALAVGLDELRAPGGAFLPVPASDTQIDASQRAWLSWQLAHTGANLQWALLQLDTLLASQPGLTCQQPALARNSQHAVPSAREPFRIPCKDPRRPASSLTALLKSTCQENSIQCGPALQLPEDPSSGTHGANVPADNL